MIVDTANTSTGLGTSREPIAASAIAILHGTSEGPTIPLEEPTAISEELTASSADASEEPVAVLDKPITRSASVVDPTKQPIPNRLLPLALTRYAFPARVTHTSLLPFAS